MAKKYKNIQNLTVSEDLYNFINKEAIPNTNITEENFWNGFSKVCHELAPKNKELLNIRNKLQMDINRWHLENYEKEFNIKEYKSFLEKIGYLKKEGADFKIKTENIHASDTAASNFTISFFFLFLSRSDQVFPKLWIGV